MQWVKLVIAVSVLAALAATGALAFASYQQTNLPESVAVARGDVYEVVEFKGHIEAQERVQLGFERSGIVAEVNVGVGDKVSAGTQLAKLDTRATELEVAQAFAKRVSERDSAAIAVQEANAALAKTVAENEQLLEQKRQAVRDAKSELDQQRSVHLRTEREEGTEDATTEGAVLVIKAKESAYHSAQEDLLKTQKTIERTTQAVRDSHAAAQEAYTSVLRASGSVAGLSQLQASEEQARVQLSKDVLSTPISGTVTAVNIESSEVALSGQAVIVVETTDVKEIVADVDEIDVPKIAVGDQARIVFDAYPDEEWQALIATIDPVGTIEDEDDVTYEVTLAIEQDEARLLPALTARVYLETARKSKALLVPRLSVETTGEGDFVYVIDGRSIERIPVRVGLRGTSGVVEILNGLTEGQQVLRRPPA